jgi:RimJ/RimL family protein N-acetyltransferase
MTILLRTERLTLRQFTPDDIENRLDLDNDAEVMRFINGGRPTSRAEVERRLTRLIADYPRLGGLGTWPAEMRASGEFVGWFALRPPPQVGPLVPGPGVAEIGYRLRRGGGAGSPPRAARRCSTSASGHSAYGASWPRR